VHYKMCSVLDTGLTFHAGGYYFVTSVTIKSMDGVKDMSNKLLSSVRTYVPLYLREASRYSYTLRIFFRNESAFAQLFTRTPHKAHNIKPNTEIPYKYADILLYQISPFMLPRTAPRTCHPLKSSALHLPRRLVRQSQQGTDSYLRAF
jgi:hypothetical protein